MDPAELFDLQDIPDIMPDIAELVPVEALPMVPVPVQQAVGWVSRLLIVFGKHALLLAFFGAFIENTILLGFLLPGGTVVALAGAAGRTAGVSLPVLVLFSALGMTFGAMVDFLCGKAGLQRILNRPWTGRIGREMATQLRNAEPLLRKHGWWVMLFAHALGPGRSSLAVAAGASGFPLGRFLLIEFPAALLWSALYAGGGFLLAAEWHNVELLLRRVGWVGAGFVVVAAVAYWFWNKKLSRDAAASETATAAETGAENTPAPQNGSASWAAGAAGVADGAPSAGAVTSASSAPPADGAGLRHSESR